MNRILDRRFIRDNPDAVRAAVVAKGSSLDVDDLLATDVQVRGLQHRVDQLTGQKKALSRSFAEADDAGRHDLRDRIADLDAEVTSTATLLAAERARLDHHMLAVPQIPWPGAPVGPDEHSNVVVRTVGKVPAFAFAPLDHVALTQRRGWAEFARVSDERHRNLVPLARVVPGDSLVFDVARLAGPAGESAVPER